MMKEPPFQTTFDALRRLWIEDLFAFEELADAEVDGRWLEGVPVIYVEAGGVLLLLTDREHRTYVRADMDVGAVAGSFSPGPLVVVAPRLVSHIRAQAGVDSEAFQRL